MAAVRLRRGGGTDVCDSLDVKVSIFRTSQHGLTPPAGQRPAMVDVSKTSRMRSILLDYNAVRHLMGPQHAALLGHLRCVARTGEMPIWSSIESLSEILCDGNAARRKKTAALLQELSNGLLLGDHRDFMAQWVAAPKSRSVKIEPVRWSGSNATTIEGCVQAPPTEVRAWVEEGQQLNARFLRGMVESLRRPQHNYQQRIRPQRDWREWGLVIQECSWLADYIYNQPGAMRRLLGQPQFANFTDNQLQISIEHPFMGLHLRHIAWGLVKVLQLKVKPGDKFLRGDFIDRMHLIHSCAADIVVTEDSNLREFCEAHRGRYGIPHAMSLQTLHTRLETQRT